jgi:hypothetical protein
MTGSPHGVIIPLEREVISRQVPYGIELSTVMLGTLNKYNMKINFHKHLFKVTASTVDWLVKDFNLKLSVPLVSYHGLLRHLQKMERSRGQIFFIKYCKFTRLALQRFISGKPLHTSQDGVGLTADGIPKVLGAWSSCLRNQTITPDTLRLLLTVLNMTRALNAGKVCDVSPIVEAASCEAPKSIGKHIPAFWKELGFSRRSLTVPGRARFSKFHLSTKVGPDPGLPGQKSNSM